MEDVFRFVVVRTVDPVPEERIVSADSGSEFQQQLAGLTEDASRVQINAIVDEFAEGQQFMNSLNDLAYGVRLTEALELLKNSETIDVATLREITENVFGSNPDQIVNSPTWKADRNRLADSLLALKISSGREPRLISQFASALRYMRVVERLIAQDATGADETVLLALSAPIRISVLENVRRITQAATPASDRAPTTRPVTTMHVTDQEREIGRVVDELMNLTPDRALASSVALRM